MMILTKRTVAGITAVICSLLSLQAQDTTKKLFPDFSSTIETSFGAKNLDGSSESTEIPGISAGGINADLNLKIKGSFSRASEWSVEKENGIEQKSGIGYEAGLSVNMAKLYEAAAENSGYTAASDTNFYSLIQPMIDWYEANRARFGLPYNPCKTPGGSPWPTTSYGGSSSRYRFIIGATVERSDDVAWTTAKWADAQALYNEIKNDISTAIDELYAGDLSTGDVSQFVYAGLSDADKRKAENKQKAIKEFKDVSSGTAEAASALSAISEAWIKITNIGHAADVRLDFAGRKLSAGNMLVSGLAGTTCKGSALAVSLKNGLVPGLEAEVAAGLAGGEAQTPENYDTQSLDYWPGIKSELALRTSARYTVFFQDISSELSVQGQGILTDMLVASNNFAVDAGVRWNTYGILSYGAGVEGMFINWRDRNVYDSDYKTSFSAAGDASAGAYGATLSAAASYKNKQFSSAVTDSSEDRFYGTSCDADYASANLNQAFKWNASLSFNPQYFCGLNIVTLTGGTTYFYYGDSLRMDGTGFFVNVETDLYDIIGIPVALYGKADYYRNPELTEWSDMSSLPDRTLIDFTSWKAGLTFTPVKAVELSVEYASNPSLSRRNSERISSLVCTGKISL